MKEYKVKICEVRYEYIDANSPCEAIKKAQHMAITDADEIKCEIVGEEYFKRQGSAIGETFTAFRYEDDGETAADFNTCVYEDDAIDFARENQWDEVVNDITGDIVWRK